MNESRNRAVLFLVQRIQLQVLVVWNDAASEGEELPPNGVVKWVVPIDQREDMWR